MLEEASIAEGLSSSSGRAKSNPGLIRFTPQAFLRLCELLLSIEFTINLSKSYDGSKN